MSEPEEELTVNEHDEIDPLETDETGEPVEENPSEGHPDPPS